LSFDFNCFDICLDPVAIVNEHDQLVYINPAFEVTYEYSNQFISKSRPKFADIMQFEKEDIRHLRDGLYYNLLFSTSKSKTGSAQVGVSRKGEFSIIFMRDLEFEDRLQAKYKALVNTLRDHNKNLTKTLEKGYSELYEVKEILSVLASEPKFCLFKVDQDFKIKDFTYKGIEKDLVLNLAGFNLLKLITQGKTEDLMFFEKHLRLNGSFNDRLAHPLMSVQFEFASKDWQGSFYIFRDQNLNINYYFSLKEAFKSTEMKSDAIQVQQNVDFELALFQLKQNKQLMLDDFSLSDEIPADKYFRNYFWQKLLLAIQPKFLSDFIKNHIPEVQFGLVLKILPLKNLEVSLKNAIHQDPSFTGIDLQNFPLKNQLTAYTKIFHLTDELKMKTPKTMSYKGLVTLYGCIMFFQEKTNLKLEEIELKELVKNFEIKLHFKAPRDPHLLYEFIKKSGVKYFEMGKNSLLLDF
jgi:hypothetical protein